MFFEKALIFGGASVPASRRRYALTRQDRLVSSLAPPRRTTYLHNDSLVHLPTERDSKLNQIS
jgi:hypothetical protein